MNFTKAILTVFSLLAISFYSQAQTVLKTEKDSLSYALGVNIGLSMKQQFSQMPGGIPNTDLMVKAIGDAFKEDPNMPIKTNEEAVAFLERYFAKIQESEFKENKEAGEKFMAENKKRSGVVTTKSGLQYKIINKGSGTSPKTTDRVKVHYEGTLIDGTVFDSSVSRGEPAVFGLTQVISGWTEVLQLMKPGDKWIVYLPYNLAYGERGMGNSIPPYSTLIFEIELIEVVK